MLYPVGERQITHTALDLLGAKAAAWTWAEGARLKGDGYAVLARVGSILEEAIIVSQWLSVLTGATAEIDSNYVKPRLRFNPEETKKIQSALLDYAPKTRKHLFTGEQWDVCSISNARTELQLGQRSLITEGEKKKTLA